ncbi:MAG: hypothetical protein DWQ04_31585 [Chloroflexi bacterium]|nr:MAG: hypothetical protein DWQ04_31585 [Chloroflexota bacterium]
MIRWYNFFRLAFNALRNWWGDWWNQVMMNIVWFLSILTVILAPPAIFAMYQQNKQVAEGSTSSAREMFKSYRSLFVISWLWMLTNLAVYFVLYTAFGFYGSSSTAWGFWGVIVVVIITLMWLMLQLYTVPVLMWQDEMSLKLAWKNAAVLLLQAPLFSIIFLLFTVIIWIISAISGALMVFGGISLTSVLGCQVVYGRLQALMPEDKNNESTTD